MVYFVDPSTFSIIPVFFIILFVALLFTLSTLFANTRRGATTALAIILFLVLRFLGVGNILNLLLILGLIITTEIYFSKNSP